MDKDKQKALEATLKVVEKEFGKGTVMRLSDRAKVQVPVIPTGSLTLDYALGIGGYPRGRIIEIYGQEASGKTTLALMAMAEAQKLGGSVLFIDAEHAFDPEYARLIGVDINDENLFIAQPDYGEQALEIMDRFVRSSAVDLIVVDSVAALVPKAELDGAMDDSTVGVHARMMSKALRKLTGAISKTRTVAIFINQVREKIGVMYGNPETTTGGRALKFFASVRLEVRRGETLKEGNTPIGHRIKVKVVKNKLAPPYREAAFDLIYGEGINRLGELFDLAVQLKIIKKAGSWFSFEGEQIAQGREKSLKVLREDSALRERIERAVLEKLKGEQGGEDGRQEGEAQ